MQAAMARARVMTELFIAEKVTASQATPWLIMMLLPNTHTTASRSETSKHVDDVDASTQLKAKGEPRNFFNTEPPRESSGDEAGTGV